MKILICGDSFASPTPVDYAWYNLLSKNAIITNVAQAGVSEYKILKQLTNQDIDLYDLVIVSHTSPNRVFIFNHPIHTQGSHVNTDLIYSDIIYHYQKNPKNLVLETAKNYFEHIFNEEYYQDIYQLIQDKMLDILKTKKSLHLTPIFNKNFNSENVININNKCNISPGEINHFKESDHKLIYSLINRWINQNV
jgi:hypothetical protein